MGVFNGAMPAPTAPPPPAAGKALLAASLVGALNTANARTAARRASGRSGVAGLLPRLAHLRAAAPRHRPGRPWPPPGSSARAPCARPAGLARASACRRRRGLAGADLEGVADAPARSSTEALHEGLGDELDAGARPDAARASDVEITRRRIVPGPIQNRAPGLRGAGPGASATARPAGATSSTSGSGPTSRSTAEAPVLVQVHGGALGHRQQGAAGHAAHGPPGRPGLGLRVDQLPAQPPGHLARPHRRREAGARLGQGQHRRPRRRPRLRAPSPAGRPAGTSRRWPPSPPTSRRSSPGFEEADTSVVAAVPFYGVYDWTNRDGTGSADMEDMLARAGAQDQAGRRPRASGSRRPP